MTSLERQWRDHVNEGAVVRWIKRQILQIGIWAGRPPACHVALLMQHHYGDGDRFIRQEHLASVPVWPGQRQHIAFPLPYVIPHGTTVLVELVIDASRSP